MAKSRVHFFAKQTFDRFCTRREVRFRNTGGILQARVQQGGAHFPIESERGIRGDNGQAAERNSSTGRGDEAALNKRSCTRLELDGVLGVSGDIPAELGAKPACEQLCGGFKSCQVADFNPVDGGCFRQEHRIIKTLGHSLTDGQGARPVEVAQSHAVGGMGFEQVKPVELFTAIFPVRAVKDQAVDPVPDG